MMASSRSRRRAGPLLLLLGTTVAPGSPRRAPDPPSDAGFAGCSIAEASLSAEPWPSGPLVFRGVADGWAARRMWSVTTLREGGQGSQPHRARYPCACPSPAPRVDPHC